MKIPSTSSMHSKPVNFILTNSLYVLNYHIEEFSLYWIINEIKNYLI
jgi:hypothetical protein